MYGTVPGARDTEMALVLSEVTFHWVTQTLSNEFFFFFLVCLVTAVIRVMKGNKVTLRVYHGEGF